MALVDKQDKVFWEIVDQRHRRGALLPTCDHARIVFDTGAITELAHHLDIVHRTLMDALRLDQLMLPLKILHSVHHFALDHFDGAFHFFRRRDVVRSRVNSRMREVFNRHACHDIDLADSVNLIAEEFDTDGIIAGIGRKDFNRIAPDSEHIAFEGDIVSAVTDFNELFKQRVSVARLPDTQREYHVGIVDGVA